MGTHTIKDSRKSRWEPWLIRRIAYTLVALLLLVAVGFGVITPEQSDAWLGNADKVLGIIAGLGLFGAAIKANPSSDVPLSEIEQARADIEAAKLTPSMVDDLVAQAKLASLQLQHARDTVAAVEESAAPVESTEQTVTIKGDITDLPVYTGPTTA